MVQCAFFKVERVKSAASDRGDPESAGRIELHAIGHVALGQLGERFRRRARPLLDSLVQGAAR